nr:hypothetical protein Iba_chr10aCG18230 [Ipomoea batatas]
MSSRRPHPTLFSLLRGEGPSLRSNRTLGYTTPSNSHPEPRLKNSATDDDNSRLSYECGCDVMDMRRRRCIEFTVEFSAKPTYPSPV